METYCRSNTIRHRGHSLALAAAATVEATFTLGALLAYHAAHRRGKEGRANLSRITDSGIHAFSTETAY